MLMRGCADVCSDPMVGMKVLVNVEQHDHNTAGRHLPRFDEAAQALSRLELHSIDAFGFALEKQADKP